MKKAIPQPPGASNYRYCPLVFPSPEIKNPVFAMLNSNLVEVLLFPCLFYPSVQHNSLLPMHISCKLAGE